MSVLRGLLILYAQIRCGKAQEKYEVCQVTGKDRMGPSVTPEGKEIVSQLGWKMDGLIGLLYAVYSNRIAKHKKNTKYGKSPVP